MKVSRMDMDEMVVIAVRAIKEMRPDFSDDNLRKTFCRGYYQFRNKKIGEMNEQDAQNGSQEIQTNIVKSRKVTSKKT